MNSNKWRNWALVFMFGGFFVMYCGMYSRALLPYLLVVGGIGVVIGILLYFRFGPVNTSIQKVTCPRCGQSARLTGEIDACPHCHLTLRRTPSGSYEPDVQTGDARTTSVPVDPNPAADRVGRNPGSP
ncbi:MAG: hypothetical protein K6T78_00050 [Alicyclobacillus sp.]|nr:hypothetical protein [Alicyclobacillus sp.]